LLNIDNTAVGSVADISAQKSKQTNSGIINHVSENIRCKLTPIKIDDINKPTIASDDIVFQFFKSFL
jgi:hypothetical protein